MSDSRCLGRSCRNPHVGIAAGCRHVSELQVFQRDICKRLHMMLGTTLLVLKRAGDALVVHSTVIHMFACNSAREEEGNKLGTHLQSQFPQRWQVVEPGCRCRASIFNDSLKPAGSSLGVTSWGVKLLGRI